MPVARRQVLLGGGALGLLGMLPMRGAWAWSSSRSVAGGDLATVPPDRVWDDAADAVVHRLFREEGITRIDELNALLRPWIYNGQAVPDGLPADLVAFLEEARQLPPWYDAGRIADGYAFNQRRGGDTGLLYTLGSGMMSCAIPDEARAVYHSKGGEDMRDRVRKTAKLGYDIGAEDVFDPSGQMIVTCIKTRLTHSAVRYLITSSPRWQAADGKRKTPAPISQRDIMVTWHSLATFIHRTLARWDVQSPATEEDGYLHTWQVTAHFLGVQDVYIPATWEDAEHQSDLTLDPVIGPTPEGIALADILLDLIDEDNPGIIRPVLNALVREMVGTTNDGRSIADMLEIPREPIWDPAIQNGWPAYNSMRANGGSSQGSNELSGTFNDIARMGVMYMLNNGRPPEQIYIEMPTANRSESSYPSTY